MTDVYAAVEAIARDGGHATDAVCDMLAVSRSAYYAWFHGEPTRRDREIESLTETVRAIFWRHRRRYGARRIAAELADRGIVCSAKRVAKVLRTQGLRAIQPKSFVPKTTESRHGLGYSPNLLLDAADPTRVDELWVGDITYLPLRRGGFCYLAALMDRFTRDIAGWSVASTMAEPLVLAALRQAIRTRQPKPGLVHHTDRGGQYAGHAYPGEPEPQDRRRGRSGIGRPFHEGFGSREHRAVREVGARAGRLLSHRGVGPGCLPEESESRGRTG